MKADRASAALVQHRNGPTPCASKRLIASRTSHASYNSVLPTAARFKKHKTKQLMSSSKQQVSTPYARKYLTVQTVHHRRQTQDPKQPCYKTVSLSVGVKYQRYCPLQTTYVHNNLLLAIAANPPVFQQDRCVLHTPIICNSSLST